MNISFSTADSVQIMVTEGRIDSRTTDEFSSKLEQAVGRGGGPIILDLGGVTYISSGGFRVLLLANKRMAQASLRLALCGLNPTVFKLLQIANFDSILPTFPSRDEALAAMR